MTEAVPLRGQAADARSEALDLVFFALSDPVRRAILERLDKGAFRVGEIAEPFDISLQAVSRHIQILVRAGLVSQARSGRISRCRIERRTGSLRAKNTSSNGSRSGRSFWALAAMAAR